MPPSIKVYTDGAARGNPGPAAIGVVVCDEEDNVLREQKQHIGEATNNEAEYRAIIAGLDLAAGFPRTEVVCTTDSELVVRQLTGVYRLKNARMLALFFEVKEKERMFERVSYRHRLRLTGHLKRADGLANEALDEAGF